MTERFYPKQKRYFAAIDDDRPLFQGDIFRGGFGAFWRHPERQRCELAGEDVPYDPVFPNSKDLILSGLVRGKGYGMLLPQPCEFSEGEKGATHPFRLVAPLFPLDKYAEVDPKSVREGRTGHTLWVPRWHDATSPQDYYVDLRWTASIDSVFLTRTTRVAALSRVAWASMADRLSRYFVGVPLDSTAFAVTQASLHPDSE
ncbi:MAG: hypothetical protein ACR2HR_01140 [Euzebya sp.]